MPVTPGVGWQIGSGPAESACKTIVGNRLKGAACVGAKTGRTPSATSGALPWRANLLGISLGILLPTDATHERYIHTPYFQDYRWGNSEIP